jgi:hypothetical protein
MSADGPGMLYSEVIAPVGLARLRSRSQAAPHALPQARTVPGQDQLLASESLGLSAAIIPIDAQPPGTDGFGRTAGRNDREDFRPSSIARTCSGLQKPRCLRDELDRAQVAMEERAHANDNWSHWAMRSSE